MFDSILPQKLWVIQIREAHSTEPDRYPWYTLAAIRQGSTLRGSAPSWDIGCSRLEAETYAQEFHNHNPGFDVRLLEHSSQAEPVIWIGQNAKL